MEPVEDIVIVGAGLAGLATALGLHRRGVKCLVLESSPAMRASGFALGIWTNAWRALDALGVGNKVREHHILGERLVVVSSSTGATSAELRLKGVRGRVGKHEFRSVKRDSLVEILANELPKDTIRYSSKVVLIKEEGDLKLLQLADASIVKARVVIGCDGIYSAVAKYLGLKETSFSGRLSARGFAEYPTNHGFNPEFLLITGGGFRAGMLPTTERSIYWFFTWRPCKKDKVDQDITNVREFIIQKLIASKAPSQIIDVVRRSEMNQVLSSHLRYRSPVSLLFGSIAKRNICVIGDALHPMTPDLGQGGCMALEDSVILARYLSDAVYNGKIKENLEKFAKERKWRCAEVVARAYIAGLIQRSSNCFISFLRKKVLTNFMAKALLRTPDYDCGTLRNS